MSQVCRIVLCRKMQSCRLVTIETFITIITIENLNSWQSFLPDNQEWQWTAFAILAMFMERIFCVKKNWAQNCAPTRWEKMTNISLAKTHPIHRQKPAQTHRPVNAWEMVFAPVWYYYWLFLFWYFLILLPLIAKVEWN